MSDIFISYSREDLDAALRLAGELERQGWSVFWDRTIPAGKSWRDVIGAALDNARCVVVLWSRASIKSDWVLEEADYGRQRQILLPLLIERVEPPLGFRGIQAADFSTWLGDHEDAVLQQLFGDIAEILGAGPAVTDEGRRKAEVAVERKAEEEQKRQRAWYNASMIRRIAWAGLLTIAISAWLLHLFPSHPPEAGATAVVFAIMFGLVYAIERLSAPMRRLASATGRRASRRRPADSSKEGK
jgi:hypothetical protein